MGSLGRDVPKAGDVGAADRHLAAAIQLDLEAGSERDRNDFKLLTVTDRSGSYDLTAIRVPDEMGGPGRATSSWPGPGKPGSFATGWSRPLASGTASTSPPKASRSRSGAAASSMRRSSGRSRIWRRTSGGPAIPCANIRWGRATGSASAIPWSFEPTVQRTRYRKISADLAGSAREAVSSPWLFSGSILAAVSPRLTAFASYSRGLEESGTAPANAVNRGEVLAAVEATQGELGLRYQVASRLSLIAGLFDTRKPVPGLDQAGRYAFVGNVRHRGIEASLAGQLTDRLNILAGLMLLDAALRGENVDSGRIGTEPVGRPEQVALLSLSWKVPRIADLTLDGSIAFEGKRFADPANSFTSPGFATVDLGLRYGFKLADVPLALRARVTNVLDKFAWSAQPSGLFFFAPPRGYGLSIRAFL